jgi:amino acid adenylation domain-containing protein
MSGKDALQLEGTVDAPGDERALPGSASSMSARELNRILVEWNQTRTDYPKNPCVHELFEEQAQSRPGAVALVQGECWLSYRELNERANQLAHYLVNHGIQPGSRVGLALERSPELCVAILAILKAGAAYAPLDQTLPRTRLSGMLQDLRVSLTLCDSACRGKLLESSVLTRWGPLVSLDAEAAALEQESTRNLRCDIRATDAAYISFTSGSTGRPKGVCVPHRGILRLVCNTNWAVFQPTDAFLQTAPIAFDASLLELWGSLLNGGRLVLPPPGLPSFSQLASLMKEQHVTVAWFTSGLFNQLIEELPESVEHLRLLITGGDVASAPHIKRGLRFLRHGRLINGYGPTENCTFSTTYTVPREYDGLSAIPIGRPVANSQCYVLDGELKPVGIGVPGELFVGGDGLALGYLNSPELTAEKFIPHPFEAGARIYRTGDLVRYREDGNIDFLGRIDAQVKIRGYRVEPGEIELALKQHPGVSECAVVAKAFSGGKRLTAYIVPRSSGSATAADYRSFLSSRLPDYMVPGVFVPIAELPLSTNGKLNRAALRDLPVCFQRSDDVQSDPVRGSALEPGTGMKEDLERQQHRLRHIWEQVLEVHPVAANDNFFALGGHSLLAMRLVERIRTDFGIELSGAAVFENPTLAQMARLLRDGARSESICSIVEIQPKGKRLPLYLVHGAGGGMFWGYSNLARHLSAERPVLAFKSRGLDGLRELETIEALAEAYAAELRAFQPRGPYLLGGYCFGGVVAYEMARCLGPENIALLALINSYPPNSDYTRLRCSPAGLARFALNVCVKSFYALPGTPQRWRALVCWKFRSWAKRAKRLVSRRGGSAAEVDAEYWQDLARYSPDECQLWQSHVRAFANYHPKPYGGPLVLFRSPSHLLFSSFDRQYGWGQFARGGVAVRVFPGAHDTIMAEPLVASLGAEFEGILAQAAQP